jgi:hypothetical protein
MNDVDLTILTHNKIQTLPHLQVEQQKRIDQTRDASACVYRDYSSQLHNNRNYLKQFHYYRHVICGPTCLNYFSFFTKRNKVNAI